jgi:APA family basic amino acid/polyamine antiporter
MLGFCAGVALVAPRYFTALAEDGHLPAAFRETRGAIVASTAFASALAIVLGFASLVDVSNVVILSGYALTCLATLVLRVRLPDRPRRYRLPLGPAIPLLAFCAAVALLVSARPGAREWAFSGVLLLVGFLCRGATALARRARTPHR